MPNWIVGSLKVRGKYEDIKRFFTEGVNHYSWHWDNDKKTDVYILIPKKKWLKVNEYIGKNGYREFIVEYLLDNCGDWTYVEDTKRAFITSDYISIYEHDPNKPIVAYCEIRQAWGFDSENWLNISQKYNLDIRLWGLECGMQFGTEIEIIDGKIKTENDFCYDSWDWECPLPWLGG